GSSTRRASIVSGASSTPPRRARRPPRCPMRCRQRWPRSGRGWSRSPRIDSRGTVRRRWWARCTRCWSTARARIRPSRGRVGRPPRPRRSTESCTSGTASSAPAAGSPWRSSRPTATILSVPSPSADRPATPGLGSRVAPWIATSGGRGYGPVARGTAASPPIALVVWWLAPADLTLLGVTAVVSVIGIWAAGREEARVGTKDPETIVVDEVAGMLIACIGQPSPLAWELGLVLAFRAFALLKPLGINRLQALPGGWGVVVDDLLAGVYVSLLGQLRHLL